MIAAILERAGPDARDARQSQQSHRRAAHAASPRCRAPVRGRRDRRESRRRSRRPREARAPDRRPHHQRRRRTSRRFRQPRRRGARGRRNGRRPRRRRATAVINADDEFAGLWRGMARGARDDVRRRECRPIFPRSDIHTAIDGGGLRHALRAARAAAARCRSSCTWRAAQRAERAVRRGRGHRRRRLARRRARGPRHNAPGSWPIAVQNRAEWRLDRGRLLQREPELDEGRDRSARERGCAALAGHGRHGRARRASPRRATRRSAASRASTASTGCSRPASCRQLAVEAFGQGGEWFADTESLARAVNAELTREVCVLVKGSRSNRLERVVEALVGSGISYQH